MQGRLTRQQLYQKIIDQEKKIWRKLYLDRFNEANKNEESRLAAINWRKGISSKEYDRKQGEYLEWTQEQINELKNKTKGMVPSKNEIIQDNYRLDVSRSYDSLVDAQLEKSNIEAMTVMDAMTYDAVLHQAGRVLGVNKELLALKSIIMSDYKNIEDPEQFTKENFNTMDNDFANFAMLNINNDVNAYHDSQIDPIQVGHIIDELVAQVNEKEITEDKVDWFITMATHALEIAQNQPDRRLDHKVDQLGSLALGYSVHKLNAIVEKGEKKSDLQIAGQAVSAEAEVLRQSGKIRSGAFLTYTRYVNDTANLIKIPCNKKNIEEFDAAFKKHALNTEEAIHNRNMRIGGAMLGVLGAALIATTILVSVFTFGVGTLPTLVLGSTIMASALTLGAAGVAGVGFTLFGGWVAKRSNKGSLAGKMDDVKDKAEVSRNNLRQVIG